MVFNRKNFVNLIIAALLFTATYTQANAASYKIHTKNSCDNARKKICNSCKLSIYDFIMEYVPSQLGIKLHIHTIEKQMGY